MAVDDSINEEIREEIKDRKVVKKVVTQKHIPGDTTAQIFWLKNRKSNHWSGGNGFRNEETEVNIYILDNGRSKGDGE